MKSYSRNVLMLLLASVITICVAGCSSQQSSTPTTNSSGGSSKTSTDTENTSAILVSDKPVYRMTATQVRGKDKQARNKYDTHKLIASLAYGGTKEYTYKDNGLTMEERNNGDDGSVAGVYTWKATTDEKGRIKSASRSFDQYKDTTWEYEYAYHGDTANMKTYTLTSGADVRKIEYDEKGYPTSIEISNTNTGARKTATFTYEDLGDNTFGMEYTDFDGKATRYMIGFDDHGYIQTIYDGTTYVDYLYEEVKEPAAWVFTETDMSQAIFAYTTRGILDTEKLA